MLKVFSLFSGGGLFDWVVDRELGSRGLKVHHLLIEKNSYAVECLNLNFPDAGNIKPIDILDKVVAPTSVNWLHASPPCTEVSQLRSKYAGETELGLQLGNRVVDFIKHSNPNFFTLENVPGYANTKAYDSIVECLRDYGYSFVTVKLDAAQYGQPCRRVRMLVIAARIPQVTLNTLVNSALVQYKVRVGNPCGTYFVGFEQGSVFTTQFGKRRVMDFSDVAPTIVGKFAAHYPMIKDVHVPLNLMLAGYPGYQLVPAAKGKQSLVVGNGMASMHTKLLVEMFIGCAV
jgi:site-specific DNA-cytosine methylase